MELISVIIPVYNIEEYLPRCLESVLAQTYENLEILLVDDGSTDKSGVICNQYATSDTRIKVIHKKNGGVSSARNLGLENANGDYIGFVDGDDIIEKKMFQRLIDNAMKHQCDISCCQMDTVNVDGKSAPSYDIKSGSLKVERVVSEYFIEGFVKDMMYSQCNKIFSKKCLEGICFKEYKYGEDILFIFEALMNANEVYYDSYIGYHYIHRKNSAMTRAFSVDRIDYIKAIREVETICKQNYPKMAEMAGTWVYQHVLVTLRHIIANNQQDNFVEIMENEKKYLRNNKKYLNKLSIKRSLDYFSIMYFPAYIKILTRVKG